MLSSATSVSCLFTVSKGVGTLFTFNWLCFIKADKTGGYSEMESELGGPRQPEPSQIVPG